MYTSLGLVNSLLYRSVQDSPALWCRITHGFLFGFKVPVAGVGHERVGGIDLHKHLAAHHHARTCMLFYYVLFGHLRAQRRFVCISRDFKIHARMNDEESRLAS